ncbi:hypothetical protein ElyMa_001776300 [Elysia marginata]|uniref:Uncharacterized protein n=1 Tax=Elysia marginata TaxID=1093978 RepID=A0AAV4ECV6_9GAST|nr:hypothetical protein ElyMa_001776300 [Elysia marginata]
MQKWFEGWSEVVRHQAFLACLHSTGQTTQAWTGKESISPARGLVATRRRTLESVMTGQRFSSQQQRPSNAPSALHSGSPYMACGATSVYTDKAQTFLWS